MGYSEDAMNDELNNDMKEINEDIKDFRHQISKDIEQLESRLLHKLTYRILLIQLSFGTIMATVMIYFHQNP